MYSMQRSRFECGSVMDLWRLFHVAVWVTSSVDSIPTHFQAAVVMFLPGNVVLAGILLQLEQLLYSP